VSAASSPPVLRDGVRGVVLGVRQALLAVEDEVGGDLHERRAAFRAFGRHVRDGLGVDGPGEGVPFAVVHLRVSRAVDHDVRPRLPESAGDRRRIRHVELGAGAGKDPVSGARQRGQEIGGEHSAGSRHEGAPVGRQDLATPGQRVGERRGGRRGAHGTGYPRVAGSFAVADEVASRCSYWER
jgi:hypothetical protein